MMSFWMTTYFFSTTYSLFIGWMMTHIEVNAEQEIDEALYRLGYPVDFTGLQRIYIFISFLPLLNTCLLVWLVKEIALDVWEMNTEENDI